MTWTYSGNPSSTTRDEVRFLVGDTNTNDQLVTDEEIAYALASESTYNAAATVAEAIAAKLSREADFSVDGLSKSLSQRADSYRMLSQKLRSRAAVKAVSPYAGGISVSDKIAVEANTDRTQPRFERGQFDYDTNTDDRDLDS